MTGRPRPAGLVEDGSQVGDVADGPVRGRRPAMLLSRVSSIALSTTPTTVSGSAIASRTSAARAWPGSGGEVRLVEQPGLAPRPQNAAKPARSSAWPPARSPPVSRLVREMDVTEGTVARAGSRPSGRRPASSQPPRPVSSSASSQPIAAVIPSSTTTTGGRCGARGRAIRSSRFSTSSRPSVVGRALGPGRELAGERLVEPGAARSRLVPQVRVRLRQRSAPGWCRRGRWL